MILILLRYSSQVSWGRLQCFTEIHVLQQNEKNNSSNGRSDDCTQCHDSTTTCKDADAVRSFILFPNAVIFRVCRISLGSVKSTAHGTGV